MRHATSMRAPGNSPGRLDSLVEKMRQLPALPDVALEALHLLEDPDYDVPRVAAAISRDPVLAIRIVGMGNSPFFGMGMRTSCVKTSILRLGERETHTAILSVAIMNVFPKLPAPLDVRRFWTFGLASAICARRLADDLDYPDGSAACLGALVHRLGEAFLAVSYPKRFAAAWTQARREGFAFEEALHKEFDVYPSELCARVLDTWKLPASVVQAVRECHCPATSAEEPLLALVLWTAGWIATELGLGLEPPGQERDVREVGLTPHLRQELHELGYAKTLEYLLCGGDFAHDVRRLGRLVAGRPGPITRARALAVG